MLIDLCFCGLYANRACELIAHTELYLAVRCPFFLPHERLQFSMSSIEIFFGGGLMSLARSAASLACLAATLAAALACLGVRISASRASLICLFFFLRTLRSSW
jgi:hypothetical protein